MRSIATYVAWSSLLRVSFCLSVCGWQLWALQKWFDQSRCRSWRGLGVICLNMGAQTSPREGEFFLGGHLSANCEFGEYPAWARVFARCQQWCVVRCQYIPQQVNIDRSTLSYVYIARSIMQTVDTAIVRWASYLGCQRGAARCWALAQVADISIAAPPAAINRYLRLFYWSTGQTDRQTDTRPLLRRLPHAAGRHISALRPSVTCRGYFTIAASAVWTTEFLLFQATCSAMQWLFATWHRASLRSTVGWKPNFLREHTTTTV